MSNPETLQALSALKQGIADAQHHLALLSKLVEKVEQAIGNHTPAPPEPPATNMHEPQVAVSQMDDEMEPPTQMIHAKQNATPPPVKVPATSKQNLNEKLGKTKPKGSPAQHYEAGPVADLKKSIPLNLKLACIRNLFAGNAEAWQQAINHLNGCGRQQATVYLEQMQVTPAAADTFDELKSIVVRRWAL